MIYCNLSKISLIYIQKTIPFSLTMFKIGIFFPATVTTKIFNEIWFICFTREKQTHKFKFKFILPRA